MIIFFSVKKTDMLREVNIKTHISIAHELITQISKEPIQKKNIYLGSDATVRRIDRLKLGNKFNFYGRVAACTTRARRTPLISIGRDGARRLTRRSRRPREKREKKKTVPLVRKLVYGRSPASGRSAHRFAGPVRGRDIRVPERSAGFIAARLSRVFGLVISFSLAGPRR